MRSAKERREAKRKALKAEILVEKALRTCRSDCEYFISKFVKIEDKDNAMSEEGGGIVVPFKLWDGQKHALKVFLENRLVAVLKARQLGLSWLALAYALWRLLFFPGYTVLTVSKKEDDAFELIRRVKFMLENLPSWLAMEKKKGPLGYGGMQWEYTKAAITIHHPGEPLSPSSIKAVTSSPDAARSFTSNLIILDEWAFHPDALSIWEAAYPTINRPTGGQVLGISTMELGSLFSEIWEQAEKGENDFYALFLGWNTDPRRTEAWYEQTKRNLKSWRKEYPATPEDARSAGVEAAFGEWDTKLHVPFSTTWYPPDSWKIIRAYDGGWRRACCKWYAVSPEGWAVCYREYYPEFTTDPIQAQTIIEMSKRPDGSSETIAYTIADSALWAKQTNSGESTAEVFAKNGVHMVPTPDKDRINGWKRLHQWLEPVQYGPNNETIAWLRYTDACKHTKRVMPAIQSDKHKPDDINTDHPDDHLLDCDRYFVMSRPIPRPDEDTIRKRVKIRKQIAAPIVSPITGY